MEILRALSVVSRNSRTVCCRFSIRRNTLSLREPIHSADTLSWLTIIFRVRNNSVDSPLLSLPAEIRLKIWDYAIGGMRIYLKDGHGVEYSIDGATETHDFDLNRQFALPRVCRQIYSETGANFYRFNVFSFEDHETLNRFRVNMKRAHWEALHTLAVSEPLVRKVHPPPLPPASIGTRRIQIRMTGGGYYRNRKPVPRDAFVSESSMRPYTPWPSFRSMFDDLRTIIVYCQAGAAQWNSVLSTLGTKESGAEVIFE